ncbi:hypothetical protein KFE98_13555 [bacterium SCSIO 12741]|nr:hypothetical protein KFE98_13555 [bacterium SCSIO 12741]
MIRPLIAFILFVSLCAPTLAQRKIWFDRNWDRLPTSKDAMYYRLWEGEEGNYLIKDYYRSGELQMEGRSKTIEPTHLFGEVVFYFKNGQIDEIGVYEEDNRIGEWIYYYDHGGEYAKGEFLEGNKTGVWEYYNDSGAVESKGEFLEGKSQGIWTYFYDNGQIESSGLLKRVSLSEIGKPTTKVVLLNQNTVAKKMPIMDLLPVILKMGPNAFLLSLKSPTEMVSGCCTLKMGK